MRAKSLLLLTLALGCGLIASIGITQVMAKRAATVPAATTNMATIFVALEDIPTGDPITAQVIKLEQWPKDKVPPGALTRLEDVENRRPKTKIYKGAPILENQLLPKGANQGATAQIPKGYRVVAVKVDDVSGSASLIRPGDRVDVLAHFQRNVGKGIDVTKTQTILEDIKVFAVNDVYDLDAAGNEKKLSAKTISLLVTPAQGEKLTLAAEMGKIRLVMRSFEDDGQGGGRGAVPEDLFGSSEASDRKKDDPAPPSRPLAAAAPADDFLSFLRSKRPEASAAPEGPREPSNWTMRVIAANQVNDVVMQMDNSQASGASAGFPRWTSTVTTSQAEGSVAKSAAPTAQHTPEPTQDTDKPPPDQPTTEPESK